MTDKRITDLTERTVASDDYLEIDGTTNGSAKIPVGRANGPAVLNASGKITDRLDYEGIASGVANLDADGMVVDSNGRKIVESGSNSNGNWVRYADGTQVCWGTKTVHCAAGAWTSSDTYDWPVAFSDAYMRISVQPARSGWRQVTTIKARASDTWQFTVYNWDSEADLYFDWIAIGRWY